MAIKDYSTNPSSNTTVNGINIGEGCPPSGVNDAIRQVMADLKSGDFGTTGVKLDLVSESTAAAGVTVDGVLLKDGGITASASITAGTLGATTAVNTDTINERTAAAGVTIDGVKLKDGGITATGDIVTGSTGVVGPLTIGRNLNGSVFYVTNSSGASGAAGGAKVAANYGGKEITYLDMELKNGTSGAEAAALRFGTTYNGVTSDKLYISPNGNLGLNTNVVNTFGSATSGLTLNGNGSHIEMQSMGSNVGYLMANGNGLQIMSQNGNPLSFGNASATGFQLDSGGRPRMLLNPWAYYGARGLTTMIVSNSTSTVPLDAVGANTNSGLTLNGNNMVFAHGGRYIIQLTTIAYVTSGTSSAAFSWAVPAGQLVSYFGESSAFWTEVWSGWRNLTCEWMVTVTDGTQLQLRMSHSGSGSFVTYGASHLCVNVHRIA